MKTLTNDELERVAQPLLELGRQHPATLALFAIIEDKIKSSVLEEIEKPDMDFASLAYRNGFRSNAIEIMVCIEALYRKRFEDAAKKDDE